jgi:L-fuconolactonase
VANGLAARHPDTSIVIDHVGLPQTSRLEGADPWADLPKVLALAKYENVRIKLSGICTLSAEAYPFHDIWDPLLRIVDAYGIERCMWGTDWTRVTALTYGQAVDAFRTTQHLSDSDRAMFMGGAAQKIYGWSPSG